MLKKNTLCILLLTSISILYCQSPLPEYTNINKPWINWYWPDNELSYTEIERQLSEIKTKGFGGVHIYTNKIELKTTATPIQEFSAEWYENLNYAIDYANQINIEVDLSILPFWPSNNDSIINFLGTQIIKTYTIDSLIPNSTIQTSIDSLLHLTDSILSVYAISNDKRKQIDITWLLNKSNYTEYFTENSGWKIYLITTTYSELKNENNRVLNNTFTYDFLNSTIHKEYLDEYYKSLVNNRLRSLCINKWQYNFAWSHDFFTEFEKRRKYKLQDYMYLFIEGMESEIKERVFSDYYETISDLIQESFIKTSQQWCNELNIKLQYYAFNSPSNILNTYSQADIPHVKQIGKSNFTIPNINYYGNYDIEKYGKPHPFIYKFASSASNLNSKILTSASFGTKISDHFTTTLFQLKSEADLLFTSGINHLYIDGMPYSLTNINWPGWLYDQSSNIGPSKTIWNDIEEFNNYISTCQQLLQSSNPDNDILLYFPVYDYWSKINDINELTHFTYSNFEEWFIKSPTGQIAYELYLNGNTFDFISDEQINNLTFYKKIESGNSKYKLIIFPRCSNIRLSTLNKILELAEKGAKIVFAGGLPKDIPGLYKYETKRLKLLDLKYALFVNSNITVAQELSEAYIVKKLRKEELAFFNINFIRKTNSNSTLYYIANLGDAEIDEYIMLSAKAEQYTFFDPVTKIKGIADKDVSGKVRIKIKPGESLFILCEANSGIPQWIYDDQTLESKLIFGKWKVSFPEGVPKITDTITVSNFYQLDKMLHDDMRYYSGIVRYEIEFDFPAEYKPSNYHIIDLGELIGSVSLIINENDIGKSWYQPHKFIINPKIFLKKENKIIIHVNTNDINRLLLTNKTYPGWNALYKDEFKGIDDMPYSIENLEMQFIGLIQDVQIYPILK
ncbi:glycosyl hydrolase [Bacteroidota bacterium]